MSLKTTSSDAALTDHKVIIVEGETDRERVLEVLSEAVVIICTGGTMSYRKMEERIIPLEEAEVFILVDADESGMKLRNQLKQELPNAQHLYTRRMYREVATTPLDVLASILDSAHFDVDEKLLTSQTVDHGSNPELQRRSRRRGRLRRQH